MKLIKPFRGARRGEAFPTDFKAGDDIPLELLAAAQALGAVGDGLRSDGPTIAKYVAAGYQATSYPPTGYASRSTPEEVAQAVAAQEARAKQEQAVAVDGQKADAEPANKVDQVPADKAEKAAPKAKAAD